MTRTSHSKGAHDGSQRALYCGPLEDVLCGNAAIAFHFQPIVDLFHGTVCGYEALARFPAPPAHPPDWWFRRASEIGRRAELEALALCGALAARPLLPPNTFLSVNIGPEFLLSPLWSAEIERQANLARTVIEVTEQESIRDYAAIRERIAQIRERGGWVAIDDTGAGYASLKHVLELRPDFIKLDQAFVSNCCQDRARTTLIEMIGETAGKLDAWVIAEGVESEEDLNELCRLGVPLAQGYLLGRPSPEMTALGEEQSRAIRNRIRVLPGSILRFTETAPVRNSLAAAIAVLEESHEQLAAIVVDEWNRPMAVVQRHPLAGIHSLAEFLKVQADSQSSDVLARALTRPLALRFDPVVVINECGEFSGILRIDALMRQEMERHRGRARMGEIREEYSPGETLRRRSQAG